MTVVSRGSSQYPPGTFLESRAVLHVAYRLHVATLCYVLY
jgi:hypothetical protein